MQQPDVAPDSMQTIYFDLTAARKKAHHREALRLPHNLWRLFSDAPVTFLERRGYLA
jgi:hypothetical protein